MKVIYTGMGKAEMSQKHSLFVKAIFTVMMDLNAMFFATNFLELMGMISVVLTKFVAITRLTNA